MDACGEGIRLQWVGGTRVSYVGVPNVQGLFPPDRFLTRNNCRFLFSNPNRCVECGSRFVTVNASKFVEKKSSPTSSRNARVTNVGSEAFGAHKRSAEHSRQQTQEKFRFLLVSALGGQSKQT